MAKRNQDPFGLGKIQRRIEGGADRGRTRYVVEVEKSGGRLSGYRGTLALFGVVLLFLLLVNLLGR